MQYKVNPMGKEELREVARKMYAVLDTIEDPSSPKSAHVKQLMEDIAISKIELEMQNEHLQGTRAMLESALTNAAELFDFASVALFYVEPGGTIGKSNFAGARMLGTERGRLTGRKLEEFFAPDHAALIAAWLADQHRLADSDRCVLSLRDTELPVKQVEMHMSHLSHGDGFLVTLTDVSEQWRLARRMGTLQEQFRLLAQIATDGFWSWDIASAQVSYSSQLTRLYGYTVEEFGPTIDAWRERIHPADRNAFLHASQDCIAGRTRKFCCDQRVQCKDGSWKWIQCRGAVQSLDPDGGVRLVSGVHIDTTDQKQMELHHVERIGQLQALFDAMPGRLALLNADGTVMQANAAWGQQGVGSHFAGVLPGLLGKDAHLRQQAVRGIADTISGARPLFTLAYTTGQGPAQRQLLLESAHVKDTSVRAYLSHQDITPVHRELAQSLDEAHFFEQAQQEFNRALRYGHPLIVMAIAWRPFTGMAADQPADAQTRAQVMGQLKAIMQDDLRASDLMGISGPDTFALLLSDTSLAGAEALAQRLVDHAMDRPIELFGASVTLTVQVGLCRLQDEVSFFSLLKRAQAAMQQMREPRGYGLVVDSAGSSGLW